MKLLYIHQYFRTPEEGGAIRSWYISTAMVKAGYEVDLITAHNQDGYEVKDVEGVRVHYIPVKYENSFGFLKRFQSFISFADKAYKYASRISDIDLLYITSTPLTVGLIALRLKRKKNLPYIFEVRDLWPEAPIQIGLIKQPWLKKITRRFELRIYNKSEKIVALSPGTKDYIENLLPDKQVHLCPNLSDCGFFKPDSEKDPDVASKFGIRNEFVISYFGAIGMVNHLEYLLNAASAIQNSALSIIILIIGSGSRMHDLKKKAAKMELSNVYFLDHVNKYKLKEYLNITDAAYLSFGPYDILEHNSPNKFFDSLASGKMVITNVKGWIKDLVETNECGFFYDPENTDTLISEIQAYLDDRELLVKTQKKARNLAEDKFDKELRIPELLEFIVNG
ncbi:glycosyltransferase family 4 protein [Bacteroidota bacterium]